jgi:hypothetical protein
MPLPTPQYKHWETFLYFRDNSQDGTKLNGVWEATGKDVTLIKAGQVSRYHCIYPERLIVVADLLSMNPAEMASLGFFIDGDLKLRFDTYSPVPILQRGIIDLSDTFNLGPDIQSADFETKIMVEAGGQGAALNEECEVYYCVRR